MNFDSVAKSQIKNVDTEEIVSMDSLWQKKPCVIIFFRRWGCMFCRVWAKEVSEMYDDLNAKGVKLVGIGPEDLGAKEFRDGGFFKGDHYVVADPKTYHNLGFKRFNYLSILASLLWSESRAAVTKGKQLGVGGNMKGDGLQNGGAVVVSSDGKVLFEFIQNGPAEHVPNETFLEIINNKFSKPVDV